MRYSTQPKKQTKPMRKKHFTVGTAVGGSGLKVNTLTVLELSRRAPLCGRFGFSTLVKLSWESLVSEK